MPEPLKREEAKCGGSSRTSSYPKRTFALAEAQIGAMNVNIQSKYPFTIIVLNDFTQTTAMTTKICGSPAKLPLIFQQ